MTVKKKVSFNEAANVSHDDNTLFWHERKQLWYNVVELRAIRRENCSLVQLMAKGSRFFGARRNRQHQQTRFLGQNITDNQQKQDKEEEEPCFRGLERASPAHARERANKVRSFVEIILKEYNKLRDMGLGYKTCSLTKISYICSMQDVKYALKMAKMDSIEAIRAFSSSNSCFLSAQPRRYGFPSSSSCLFFNINNRKKNTNIINNNNTNKNTDKVAPLLLVPTTGKTKTATVTAAATTVTKRQTPKRSSFSRGKSSSARTLMPLKSLLSVDDLIFPSTA